MAANVELQEHDALKTVGLAATMTTATTLRGLPDATAHVAAEPGVLAFKIGFARWTSAGNETDTTSLTQHTLAAPRTSAAPQQT